MKRVILALVLAVPLSLGYSGYDPKIWLKEDVICMADNIHYEARGEPEEGKRYVARTVLNRLKSPKFKETTVCEVVYAKRQYSWTTKKRPKDVASPEDKLIALEVMHEENTGKVLYFHSKNVKPSWRTKLSKYKVVGNHVFYHDEKE